MESNRVRRFEKANAIKSTRFSHPTVRATIDKSNGLVLLVMSSLFKYDYLRSHTSITPTSSTAHFTK